MVHSILDAAYRLLKTEGATTFTTNHVAAEAGVSVGSVYQYFASGDAIVAAVFERGLMQAEGALRSFLPLAATQPPDELFQQGFDTLVDLLLPYRQVIAELLRVLPLFSSESMLTLLETQLMNLSRDYLVLLQGRYVVDGGLSTLYVAVNSTAYAFLKWLVDQPPSVPQDEFKAALVGMMTRVYVPPQTLSE